MTRAAWTRRLRSGHQREDGSATIEFVLMFPMIMFLFFSSFEVSIFLARAVMLDRALDINVRALRLGALNPTTADELKRRVCEDAMILPDCQAAMTVELVPISKDSWALPASSATCVNRGEELQPAVDFKPGSENEIMLVRVCAVLDPFFGSTPLVMDMPVDATGGYVVTAATVFVNEP